MELDLESSPSPNLPQEIDDNVVNKKLDFSNISNTPSPPPSWHVPFTPSLTAVDESGPLLHQQCKLRAPRKNKENAPNMVSPRKSPRLMNQRRKEEQLKAEEEAEEKQPQMQHSNQSNVNSSPNTNIAQDDDDIIMEIVQLNMKDPTPTTDEQKDMNKEWDAMFLCRGLHWNSNATPTQSSLKVQKTKARTSHPNDARSKTVIWGNVSVRNFEQRCGVLSCGVPSENGPSLHLGKFLSSSTSKLDQYETDRRKENRRGKNSGELSKRERMARVKQFNPDDLQRKKLRQDRMEIDELQKSRTNIGCECVSVYKMKKEQLMNRIMKLTVASDEAVRKQRNKELNKLKKKELFQQLLRIQLTQYGRYDVCCVDDDCACFRQGIECQIDSVCCKCGGDTVYNNNLISVVDAKSVKKQDSLSCANPNGNTLNISVLDFVDANEEARPEHEVVTKAESEIVPFASPCIQKRINDWNEHYDVD